MNIHGNATRLAALTRELLAHWDQTKDHWRDAKSAEFEARFIEELKQKVGAAVTATEKLSVMVQKIRSDCD